MALWKLLRPRRTATGKASKRSLTQPGRAIFNRAMRTFVFGAGASVHAGYPLAATMWPAMERWVAEMYPPEHIFRSVADGMDARFDMSKSFELVLTDLDNEVERLAKANPAKQNANFEKHILLQLRENVKRLIPAYFKSLRHNPAPLYTTFAAHVLKPGDAVITFNYDLALDREMKRSAKWSVGDGYGFHVDSASFGTSSCKLFKLHGSTNWRGELFQGFRGFGQGNWEDRSLGQRPVIDRAELEYLGYDNASDPQCHNGQARIESLIMPTANKKFFIETSFGKEWEGFWDSLWFQAGEALRLAEGIYVIGYSIPEYDSRASELLARKISNPTQIRVCCRTGTDSVIESLKHLGLTNAHPASARTFEGLIEDMKSQ